MANMRRIRQVWRVFRSAKLFFGDLPGGIDYTENTRGVFYSGLAGVLVLTGGMVRGLFTS